MLLYNSRGQHVFSQRFHVFAIFYTLLCFGPRLFCYHFIVTILLQVTGLVGFFSRAQTGRPDKTNLL